MPRVDNLLTGLGSGIVTELYNQRKRKQDLDDKVALAEAEAKIRQQNPLRSVMPYVIDTSTGQVMPATVGNGQPAVLSPGSRVFARPLTPETVAARERAKYGAQAEMLPEREQVTERMSAARQRGTQEAEAAGLPLKPLPQEAATVVSSAESAMDAIDQLLQVERQAPGATKKALVAGATPLSVGVAFGDQNTQRADLLLKRLRTEITTARGGKQLTQTEIRFINQLIPNVFRAEAINEQGLGDLREFLGRVRDRIVKGRGTTSSSLTPKITSSTEDMSQYTDEELQAIANGGE